MKTNQQAVIGRAAWALAAGLLLLAGCQRPGQPEPVSARVFSTGRVDGQMPSAGLAVVEPAAAAPAALVSSEDLKALGLRSYWTSRLMLASGDRIDQVQLLGGNLVALSEQNTCYAIEGRSGIGRPLAQVADPQRRGLIGPTFDGVRYWFAGHRAAVGINVATGAADVRIELEFPAACAPVSDKKYVYVGGFDGRIFVYAIASQVKHWNGKVGPAVTSLGLSRDNLVAVRSDVKAGRAELLCIRPGLWVRAWPAGIIDGPVAAPVVCTDEALFIAGEDRSLCCFDAQNGWPIWRCRTPSLLLDPPVLLDKQVVQIVPDVGTWLLDRIEGTKLWTDPARLRYLGQIEDRMYFFDGERLLAKRADDGKTLGSAPVRGAADVLTVPNPDQTKLYLVRRDGRVLCCNDIGQPFLTIDQIHRRPQ